MQKVLFKHLSNFKQLNEIKKFTNVERQWCKSEKNSIIIRRDASINK